MYERGSAERSLKLKPRLPTLVPVTFCPSLCFSLTFKTDVKKMEAADRGEGNAKGKAGKGIRRLSTDVNAKGPVCGD